MTMNEGSLLSDDGLDALREYMDETSQGSFWVELLHMERNGFDIARQKKNLDHYIQQVEEAQGWSQSATDPQRRAIALSIRKLLRDEAGLAPLSVDEAGSWNYTTPVWVKYPECHGEPRQFDAADVRLVADWIAANDPDLIRYIKSVAAHNEPLGFNGGPHDREIIRALWASTTISAAAALALGPNCPSNVVQIWRIVWDEIAAGDYA